MGKQSAWPEFTLKEPAHSLPFEDVLKGLSSDHQTGLTEAEAQARKAKYGPNQLDEGPGVQPIRILVHQVANALTLVRSFALAIF